MYCLLNYKSVAHIGQLSICSFPNSIKQNLKSLLIYSHLLDLPQTHTCLSQQGNVLDSYNHR